MTLITYWKQRWTRVTGGGGGKIKV